MRIDIKSRWDNSVILSTEAESLKAALQAAVKSGANLRSADLYGRSGGVLMMRRSPMPKATKPMKRTPVRTSKRTRTKHSAEATDRALAYASVFHRDGHCCAKCGTHERLHYHHVVPRRRSLKLRWDPRNGLVLCVSCHRWWHEYPIESGPWFQANWPERWQQLIAAREGR